MIFLYKQGGEKIKSRIKKSVTILVVMIMVFAMPLTAYAATQTKNATTKMSVALMPGASGNTATTTLFTGENLSGTWYVYANCTCYSGTTLGYSSSVYYPVSITATY